MSASSDAMQTLSAQWYNAMVTGLQLSDQQFQLFQGTGTTPKTSQDLWSIFNAVPPKSINNFYDPSQANSFASDYNLILTSLVTGNDSDFQNCMGDYYGQWITYFKANVPSPFNAATVSTVFNTWAMINAPSQSGCVSALTKALINPVMYANTIFQGANGNYAWNQTIDALQTALNGGQSKSFTLDTATASSDISHTWANGSASGLFDFFSIGGGASYDNLTTKLTSANINISASYQKLTTFAAGPYAQTNSNNPALSSYSPWYVSSILALAYTTQDNTVWNNAKPVTWDKAFGPAGFLQRMATALVVADGITITTVSSASFNTSDQTTITAAASGGFWPFFSASGSGGSSTTVTFDDQGRMTATTKSALGNPQILGVLQSPISSIFS
ncbi:hypothetical protein ABIB62_003592 [Mucilaginibacter sp. UYP25]|uniref:hypothetical protein n=1 Tax=unclassified Mucilaginibacter TaxID=2617802 RepID=UPI00339790B5